MSNAIRRQTMEVSVPARTRRTAAFGNAGAVSRNDRGVGAFDTHFLEAPSAVALSVLGAGAVQDVVAQ